MLDNKENMLPDLKGKRVLITGGLGFIGSNIAHYCVRLGAEVFIYDCLDPRSGGNMKNLVGIENQVEIIINDIRNFESLCSAVLDKHLIFNCAAYTSHPNSMREPLIDIDVNCKGVINILEALRRFNPEGRLVHIGTSTQIGRMHRTPIDEFHPEYPLDIYSANKSASEKYVLAYSSAYRLWTTVIRLANNFGPRSNIKSSDFGFMNFFIGLGLKGKEVTVFGDGSQLRNVSYVEDSIQALLLAAHCEQTVGKAFFAVADQQCSIAEIAEAIGSVIGGQVRYVEWPKDRQNIEIGDAVISNERLKKVLDWEPRFSLIDGLQRTKEYFEPLSEHYLD